jgi:selenocysteine lyase/cysteine desulfurase
LDNAFGIAVRAGLHCARDAHEILGTIDKGGTLRISPGCFNTTEDVDQMLEAAKLISQE